jgi:protein involved in polysaccharide export with SLBB domain
MKCLAVLLAVGLCSTTAWAAPRSLASHDVPAESLERAANASAGPIQPGDTLDIQVAGETGMTKSYTVDSTGAIIIEMVGAVRVAGRSAAQVAEDLKSRLRHYLKHPHVTVARGSALRQEILLTGEVARAGVVTVGPGAGLLDVLAAVGGLTPSADGSRATLTRRGESQPTPVDVARLLTGDVSQNLPVRHGDILQVPKKETATFQIVGEVRAPGTRVCAGEVSILDALVAAGGLTDRADRNRLLLTRKGESQPIEIDLDQVLNGAVGGAPSLKPGDVLQVGARLIVSIAGEVKAPGERLLRHGGTLMEAITSAGGFGPDADRTAIQITHRDATTETVSVDGVTGIVGGPELRSGDLVFVSRGKPQVVSISGAVRNPGAMRYQDGMKVSDVLMAVGLADHADWKNIRVLRGDTEKGREIKLFNLEQYLKSPEGENPALKAGDQIFVEARSKGARKNLARRLADVLPLARLFFLF